MKKLSKRFYAWCHLELFATIYQVNSRDQFELKPFLIDVLGIILWLDESNIRDHRRTFLSVYDNSLKN